MMCKFSKTHLDLPGPLSLPLLLVPWGLSWVSPFLVGWSLAAVLFTVWRLTVSLSSHNSEAVKQDRAVDARRVVRSLASATAALQLLPILWLAALGALEGGTRALPVLAFSHRALLWGQSSGFAAVLFWLVLFGLVALLLRISRKAYAWHRYAASFAFPALSQWMPAPVPLQAGIATEEVHCDAD
jgi:hypothetical protein